jgi:hypothetical protein
MSPSPLLLSTLLSETVRADARVCKCTRAVASLEHLQDRVLTRAGLAPGVPASYTQLVARHPRGPAISRQRSSVAMRQGGASERALPFGDLLSIMAARVSGAGQSGSRSSC